MGTLEERCTPDAKLLEVFEKVTDALDTYNEWKHEWINQERLNRDEILTIEEDLIFTKRKVADLIADKLVMLS